MAFILNIETAVEGASVSLSQDEQLLSTAANAAIRDSAAWLHMAMDQVMIHGGVHWQQLNAVAVSSGPGSYTGLRVGMAAAKGLCFALNIPLLCVSSLKLMAAAARQQAAGWLCPMIDARRMEVFTALYNQQLEEIMPVSNLILTGETFSGYLNQQPISFFGNGSKKFQQLCAHTNALFIEVQAGAADMVPLSHQLFHQGRFEALAYSEPDYGKDFYTPAQQKRRGD